MWWLPLLLLWLSLAGVAAEPRASAPQWLISAQGNPGNLIQVAGVEPNTANNNLAIALYKGRLYFAFRSATHHHPKPPSWEPIDPTTAITRMYLLSADLKEADLRDLSKVVPSLSWRLELEVNDQLRERVSDKNKEFDLREPSLVVEDGKLHFFLVRVAGMPMTFRPLESWRISLDENTGQWKAPETILAKGEHYWDIKVRKEEKGDALYMTTYSGKHYAAGGLKVHLRRSEDGVKWENVGPKSAVDEGGICEAGILFDEGRKKLWSVNRLEDGDKRGWGTLVGSADYSNLSEWSLPPNEWGQTEKTDPRRYDSPRLFQWKDRIYLVARQNIGPDGNENENYPFDGAFAEKAGEKIREERLQAIREEKLYFFSDLGTLNFKLGRDKNPLAPGVSRRYQMDYHFDRGKRTALYELNPDTRGLTLIQTLPSAGDTAFPSLVDLGNGTFLLANYSSDPAHPEYTWNEGQRNRTGVYLMTLQFTE